MDLLWIKRNMHDLWTRSKKRYVAIHDNVKSIPQDLSDILPAVHSLTGSDATSKISTKYNAIKTINKDYYHLLTEF